MGSDEAVNLDMRLVIQFVTVADELSFTRAAARLGVAQPWLSARIRKLEEQLGFPLFERSTRHVALTERGRAFHELARPLAAMADRVRAGAESLKRETAGRLRVGNPPSGGPDPRKAALLERFARANPQVSLELEPGFTLALLDRLRRGLLDAAFAVDALDGDGIETLRLHRLVVTAILRPDDPLAGEPALHADQLRDRPVAVFARGINPRFFDHVYGGLGAAGARFVEVPELRRSLLTRPGAPAGLLLASLVPEPSPGPGPGPGPGDATVRHDGTGEAKGTVVRRPILDAPAIWLHLARRRDSVHSRAVERLWDAALTVAAAS